MPSTDIKDYYRRAWGIGDRVGFALGTGLSETTNPRYSGKVYRVAIKLPPGMKNPTGGEGRYIEVVRKKTPENLAYLKKIRDEIYKEINKFYGPNRIKTKTVLDFWKNNKTMTAAQVAEKFKGKIGPTGYKFTAESVRKIALDAGIKGQLGKSITQGRSLKELKELSKTLPNASKYLAEYNKTKDLSRFRLNIHRALGQLAKTPEQRKAWRAAWLKTEKGAASHALSEAKRIAKTMEKIGKFNAGNTAHDKVFHSLWRSATQAADSRWKMITEKPEKWTNANSKAARFYDTKTRRIITHKNLEKYLDEVMGKGTYKKALEPWNEAKALKNTLINYKGSEKRLGSLLQDRFFTKKDLASLKIGNSAFAVHHPANVRNNWWRGQVTFFDDNKRLNDLERTFTSQMKKFKTDTGKQKILKSTLKKDIAKLGPIALETEFGKFGRTSKQVDLLKYIGKKAKDPALTKGLASLAGKGGLKGLRFVPGLGLIVTAGFAGYGIYDAIKKGYMSPEDLLASAVWGSGVDIGPKNKVKTENEESVAS